MAVRIEAGHDGAPLAIKTTNGADENGRRRLHAEHSVLETLWVPGLVELVPGGPDEVRTRYVGDRTLATVQLADPAVVAAIMAAVAETVAVLHSRGVSHGGLTADHVLLDERGQPVLCSLSRAGLSSSLSTIVGPHAAPFAPEADTQALGAMLEALVLRLPLPEGRGRARRATTKRTQLRSIAAAAGHRVGLLHATEFAASLAAFSEGAGLPARPADAAPLGIPATALAAPPPLPPTPAALENGPPTLPSAPPPPPPPLPPLPPPTPPTSPTPPSLPLEAARPTPPPLPVEPARPTPPTPVSLPREPAPPLGPEVALPPPVPIDPTIPILIGSVGNGGPNGPIGEPATRDFGPRRVIRSAEVDSGRRLPLRLAVAAGVALVVGAGTTTGVLLLSPGGQQAAAGPATTSTAPPAAASAPTLQSAPAPRTVEPPAVPAPPPTQAPTTTAPLPCPTDYAAAAAAGIPSHCPVTITGSRVQLGELRWVVGDAGDRLALGDAGCDGRLDVIVATPATGEVFLFTGWAAPSDTVRAQLITEVPGLTGVRWDGDPCGVLTIEAGATTSTIPARNVGGR